MGRRWRLVMVVAAVVVGTAALGLAALAGNAATGSRIDWWPSWSPSMNRYFLWWLAGALVAVAGSTLWVWWAQRWYERGLAALIPAAQRPESWVVDRPDQLQQIVQALRKRSGGTVGITTAVHGAGGFGKTTVARLARADRRVLRRFGGRIYWVTLGRDVRRGGLVEKVNDLVRRIDAGRAQPFTDVRQAAEHLAAVLAQGPRRLIVLDDVWFDDQLAAFPIAGKCARLVTTRSPSLVADRAIPINVGQMSDRQAGQVLTAGLTALPAVIVEALLVETGRWPVLLRLANRNLAAQAQSHTDMAVVAEDLLQRLRHDGALHAAGHLPGVDARLLDINDPDQRSKAVAATIEASAGLLTDDERARLDELGIFVEDETIPVSLVAALWQATGGLGEAQTRMVCARLADLALLTLTPTDDGGTISLHDVIRDYLREHLGPTRLTRSHQVLLDSVASAMNLPCAPSITGTAGEVLAWWDLPQHAHYLREHLTEHLLAADRHTEAETLATDLRWVRSRLDEVGPVAPFADLSRITTPQAGRLARLLGQNAHLLRPTDPPHSRIDILYSRIDHDPDWGPQARTLTGQRTYPALVNARPLPDLPDPALRRTLTGHTGWVWSVAVSPDGAWLATAGYDGEVRLWDATTGAVRATFTAHARWVRAVAVSPDGAWLATVGGDGEVRLWDATTGAVRATFTAHAGSVQSVAIAPDSTWLATAGDDNTVRLWDADTATVRATFTAYARWVQSVAIAPDGAWLATAGGDGEVRLWDATTGAVRATFTAHVGWVWSVAIAPDGTWLATAGDDGEVRLWDATTGAVRATFTAHAGLVRAVAIAPDGTWLASAGDDGEVRLWDATTGAVRATLTGHPRTVRAVAVSPDGAWLATAGSDGEVRLWDAVTGVPYAPHAGHAGLVRAVAVAPDGTWLATASDDNTVRLWDATTGAVRATLTGHPRTVRAVAIAPDGTWLATGSDDNTVRLWDADTGTVRGILAGHAGLVWAVAIAPDGTWLATASDDRTVRLWDAVTGTVRATFTGHIGSVRAVAIAPDGTWLATGSKDHMVRLWDAVTGTVRGILAGHVSLVRAVAIAPDGTWLATASDDRTVRLWDAVTGTVRATFTGHIGSVRAVAIAPDGTWLATASDDHTVRIWNVRDRTCIAVMRVEGALVCCAWDVHSYELVLGGTGGLYRFTLKLPAP